MDKNEWLAIKVMGFGEDAGKDTYFWREPDKLIERFMFQKNWNPPENIEQCFMLLERYGRWDITTLGRLKTVRIIPNTTFGGLSLHKNEEETDSSQLLTEAITEAVLQASGFYEHIERVNKAMK